MRLSIRALLRVLLVLSVLYGIGLRVQLAVGTLFFGDEWHTLALTHRPLLEVAATFDGFGTGIGYPLAAAAGAALLGPSALVLRLPALVGGVAALALTYVVGRRFLGRESAWIGAAALALSSYAIFYSAFARSYSLVCAGALLLAWGACTLLRPEPRLVPATAAVVGATALLPWLHLTAASSVVGLGGGALAALAVRGRWRRLLVLLVALLAGAGLSALLHAPAWDELHDFVDRKTNQGYYGEFGVLDVAALWFGSRWLAVAACALALLGLADYAWTERARALPLVGAVLAPPLAVLAVRPFGDAYAYARYAIAALPFGLLFCGYAVRTLVRRLQARDATPLRGEVAALAGGLVLAWGLFVVGPYGPRRTDDGVFASSYLSLFPLPAFDRVWPGLDPVYVDIAQDPDADAVLEIPQPISRGVFLLRNAALVHGKRVQTGFMARPQHVLPRGCVSLARDDWLEDVDADYVILHLDVVGEIERYWEFVYGAEGVLDGPGAAYLRRHERFGRSEEEARPEVVAHVSRTLGPPLHRTAGLVVWKVPLD